MVLMMVARVYNGAERLLRREEGQGMVEYGLIIGVLAVALIVGFVALKDTLYVTDAVYTSCPGGDPAAGLSGKVPGVFNKIICKLK